MKDKLIKILMNVGVSEANAKLIADEQGDATKINETEILNEIKAHQLSLHENEPSIISKIESSVMARERDKVERKIKQLFGLTAEEIKDKKMEEIIALAKTKANAPNDKTLNDLQQELLDKTNQLKDLTENQIPAIRAEVESDKKKFLINEKLTKKVSSYKLRNPLEDVMASVQMLNSQYDIDLDDKNELVYKVKGQNLLVKNPDGTKFMTADEIIKSKLENGKFLAESNADDSSASSGTGTGKIIDAGTGKSTSEGPKLPGLAAAEENLKQMKEKKG